MVNVIAMKSFILNAAFSSVTRTFQCHCAEISLFLVRRPRRLTRRPTCGDSDSRWCLDVFFFTASLQRCALKAFLLLLMLHRRSLLCFSRFCFSLLHHLCQTLGNDSPVPPLEFRLPSIRFDKSIFFSTPEEEVKVVTLKYVAARWRVDFHWL